MLLRMSQVSQMFLTHEEDKRVNQCFSDAMPNAWRWEDENCDWHIRYKIAGLINSKDDCLSIA